MLRRIAKWKLPLAFLAAFFMMSGTAQAAVTFDFSVATATVNTYSNTTTNMNYGTTEFVTQTTNLPTGWRVAQQTGTSPISPVPLDGHTVGTGTATATWEPFCGLAASNLTLTVKWEATIDAGAPANTVAQMTVTAGSLFNTTVYTVRQGTNDYDLVVTNMPDEFACDGKASSMTLTLYGSYAVAGTTYRVAQNPSTAGNYTATVNGTTAGGTNYTTSDTQAIS